MLRSAMPTRLRDVASGPEFDGSALMLPHVDHLAGSPLRPLDACGHEGAPRLGLRGPSPLGEAFATLPTPTPSRCHNDCPRSPHRLVLHAIGCARGAHQGVLTPRAQGAGDYGMR